MERAFDAIVVGLGAVGSAALCALARRGVRVLGIDRHSPPHEHGSSHGDTRITRLAIGEGEGYTPLALRSHELWRQLERETGKTLLTATGGLIISGRGPRAACHGTGFYARTLAAARRHGIRHELLDAREIRRRFPPFAVADDETGYFEPDAGFLRPEACVAAQLDVAARHGAIIRRDERVLRLEQRGGGVRVVTERETCDAGRVVLAAGPWLPALAGAPFARLLTVRRQVLHWFDVRGGAAPFEPARFPVFIWELPGRAEPIYGFPAIDGPAGGVKVATEQHAEATTPETVRREVSPAESAAFFDASVAPFLPGLAGRCLRSVTCLYTVTPDFQFLVDVHPDHAGVVVASPCSGHGFKHSPAVGEALAGMALGEPTLLDGAGFGLERFGA